MHHLLPFHGVAHVAYLPGERISGCRSSPKRVGVVIEAEHLCMSPTTPAPTGLVRDDPRTRSELLSLVTA